MVYLSLFFNQVELTGNSIFEYIHNYDQDEMNAILSLHPHINQHPVSRASVFPQSPLKHLKMFALSFFLSPSLSLSLTAMHPSYSDLYSRHRPPFSTPYSSPRRTRPSAVPMASSIHPPTTTIADRTPSRSRRPSSCA